MENIKTLISTVKLPAAIPLKYQVTKPGPPERLTVLCYGPPGSGKTHFAGTFPKPFFIDCQGGIATVRDKQVAYVQPTTYIELLKYITGLVDTDFETLVLDTATEAFRIVMEASTAGLREIPQMQDWMQTIERGRQLLRKLLSNTKKHIVVVCEEDTKKDEEIGRILVGPAMPGKLFHEAGALFDCVFPLRSGLKPGSPEKIQVVLTKPEGLYQQAKCRYKGLDKTEPNDFEVIWAKLNAVK